MTPRDETKTPSYGGKRARIRCPQCGYELTLIDDQFMDYGPVRCGACGTEIQASAIRRLATDPPLRQRMGAAGRQRVQRQYSVARWGPDLAAAVAQAADRAAAAAAMVPGRNVHVAPERRPSGNGPVPAEPRFLPRQRPRDAALERQP